MKHTAYFRLPQILVLLQTRLGGGDLIRAAGCARRLGWLSYKTVFAFFCFGYVMELLGIQVLFTKLRSPERLRNVRHVSYWQEITPMNIQHRTDRAGQHTQDTQGKQCMRYTLNEVFKWKDFSASTGELKLSTYHNCSAGIRRTSYGFVIILSQEASTFSFLLTAYRKK